MSESKPNTAIILVAISFVVFLVTLMLCIAKLAGAITWSWFWVLSPLLIPSISLILLIFAVLVISWFGDRS